MGVMSGDEDSENGSMGMKAQATSGTPAAVELGIDELVLHGSPRGDRFRIGNAVGEELPRLIAEQGLTEPIGNPVSVTRLDDGRFDLAEGSKPRVVGFQLAQLVHRQFLPAKDKPLLRRRSNGTQVKR